MVFQHACCHMQLHLRMPAVAAARRWMKGSNECGKLNDIGGDSVGNNFLKWRVCGGRVISGELL